MTFIETLNCYYSGKKILSINCDTEYAGWTINSVGLENEESIFGLDIQNGNRRIEIDVLRNWNIEVE